MVGLYYTIQNLRIVSPPEFNHEFCGHGQPAQNVIKILLWFFFSMLTQLTKNRPCNKY